MSYSNGVISAPVTIDDVKAALGKSSNDLATLCKSENINGWSKYKPLNVAKNFIDKLISVEEEWIDSYHITGLKGYVRCGMSIPWMSLNDINLQGGFESYPNALMAGKYWRYVCPQGGKYPYRLGDFRNYTHNARKSIMLNTPENYTIKVTFNVKAKIQVILYKPANLSVNNILLEDIISHLSDGDYQFGVYLSYKNGKYVNGALVKNETQILGTIKLQDYTYFDGFITPNYINGNDEIVTIYAYFLYEKSTARYILLPWLPCLIEFVEMKRVIMAKEFKSGSSSWSDTRELSGNVLMMKIGITKINQPITIGSSNTHRYYFRITTRINNVSTTVNGVPITSSGSNISSYTVPTGNGSDLYYVYIKFSGIYDQKYYNYGEYLSISLEFNETGKWETVDSIGLKLISL